MLTAVLRFAAMFAAVSVLVLVGSFDEATAATNPYTYLSQFGSSGSGNGQFASPRGLAFDASGNLYVADMSNNRIQKFDSSDNFVLEWGPLHSSIGSLSTPTDVAVDSLGNVYVADSANNRIMKFDTDSNYVITIGNGVGSGDGQFHNQGSPTSIAIDSQTPASSCLVFISSYSRNTAFTNSGSSSLNQCVYKYRSFSPLSTNLISPRIPI